MRLIDADELNKVKFHPLPYTHIVPADLLKAQTEAYERGWNDAIDAIIENAETIEPQQWIPVTEKMPEDGKDVLCYYGENNYGLNFIDEDGEWYIDGVVAWMPIPKQ